MITDTAFYRNANYHTIGDTAERLDYQRMSQVVEGVYAAVMDQARCGYTEYNGDSLWSAGASRPLW